MQTQFSVGLGHYKTTKMINTELYTDMLKDEDRNRKYYEAIKYAIDKKHEEGHKAIVLDIGSGTGLLSVMAAELGADAVYACEEGPHVAGCSLQVFKANGVANKIKLIQKRSTSLLVGRGLDIPTKANILVTEIFDTEFLGEYVISTINDAHKRLLTHDCIAIPDSCTIYAVVPDSAYFTKLNILQPIEISKDIMLSVDDLMANCSSITNGDHDVQLNKLCPGSFTKLSNSLEIFTFKLGQPIQNLEYAQQEFVVAQNGKANVIFSWWELNMVSESYCDDEKITISLRPTWAGGESNWRFHWKQSAYYGFTPVELREGNVCYLGSYHNELSYWFCLGTSPQNVPSTIPAMKPNACACHLHEEFTAFRLGSINSTVAKQLAHLRSSIVRDGTICVCLSEASVLPLLAAGLGAKVVYILSDLQNWTRLLAECYAQFGGNGKIRVISWDKVQNLKIDLVIADPYFKFVQKGLVEEFCLAGAPSQVQVQHKSGTCNNLEFWHKLQRLRSTAALGSSTVLMPQKGILKAVAVNVDHLMRIYEDVGLVCDGRFKMGAYTQIRRFDLKPDMDHYMHNYGGIACSTPFTLMTFNFLDDPDRQRKTVDLVVERPTNALVAWMEWQIGENESQSQVMSCGVNVDIKVGEPIKWNMHWKQTLVKVPKGTVQAGQTLRVKTVYEPDQRDLKITMSVA